MWTGCSLDANKKPGGNETLRSHFCLSTVLNLSSYLKILVCHPRSLSLLCQHPINIFLNCQETLFLLKGGPRAPKGVQSPPFWREKGAPANFLILKCTNQVSFGINWKNTAKIPTITNQKYWISKQLYLWWWVYFCRCDWKKHLVMGTICTHFLFNLKPAFFCLHPIHKYMSGVWKKGRTFYSTLNKIIIYSWCKPLTNVPYNCTFWRAQPRSDARHVRGPDCWCELLGVRAIPMWVSNHLTLGQYLEYHKISPCTCKIDHTYWNQGRSQFNDPPVRRLSYSTRFHSELARCATSVLWA